VKEREREREEEREIGKYADEREKQRYMCVGGIA